MANRAEIGEYRVNGPRFYTSKLNFDPRGLCVILTLYLVKDVLVVSRLDFSVHIDAVL